MEKLAANESVLTGQWIVEPGRVRRDSTCERIEWLIEHHLKEIAASPVSGAWEMLYQDPDDGRYWEKTYPKGEMHGGGPPALLHLPASEAEKKYGIHSPAGPQPGEEFTRIGLNTVVSRNGFRVETRFAEVLYSDTVGQLAIYAEWMGVPTGIVLYLGRLPADARTATVVANIMRALKYFGFRIEIRPHE